MSPGGRVSLGGGVRTDRPRPVSYTHLDVYKRQLIAGAGFDVLTVEPPRNGNPLLEVRRPNFILTPHVAWASDGAMQFLADQLVDNIDGWAAGSPRNLVT